MDDINIFYVPSEHHSHTEDEKKQFFEIQDVIKKDFERLLYILENYHDNEDKNHLIKHISNVINSIKLNRDIKVDMTLDIILNHDYLVFSYYDFKDDEIVFDTPTIVIMRRDLHEIYFINETYSIFDEEKEESLEIDPDYNYGNDEIYYFELNNKEVTHHHISMQEYTATLFNNAFYDTYNFTNLIKGYEKKKSRI